MLVNYQAIRQAEIAVNDLKVRFLKERGWSCRQDIPGHHVGEFNRFDRWQKVLPDGRIILVQEIEEAVSIARCAEQ